MEENTLIKKRDNMEHRSLVGCHGGKGSVDSTEIFNKIASRLKKVNFIHDTVLPPRTSIGIHKHDGDEEYYYIISGKGIMTLDEKKCQVEAGDITAVFPGGSHGLENNSDGNLRIIVISISC